MLKIIDISKNKHKYQHKTLIMFLLGQVIASTAGWGTHIISDGTTLNLSSSESISGALIQCDSSNPPGD